MLLSKTVKTTWNPSTYQWYKMKGYKFTKIGDELEVKVEHLPDNSHVLINVQCDGCGEILKDIIWVNYKKNIKEDGKYYCHTCSVKLFGVNKQRKTKLKNSKSFYQWCYDNLPKEEADRIMARWDYELNIDAHGNILSPKDISYNSQGFNNQQAGYWFKCLAHLEHKSEQKQLTNITRHLSTIDCDQCNMINITHPEIIKYLVNAEDAYKYSVGSSKKIPMKCPHCSHEKKITIQTLLKSGFGCPKCSDGISYPEKFLFNVFEQLLKKDFQTQLSKATFNWCEDYRYDFYINKLNGIIVETMGLQHYEDVKGWDKSLEEIQINDFNKEWLAKSSNIKHYIILDCRKSELEWIKNSIMKSRLPNLLNFKEEDIDWLKCHEYACSSLVKTVCDLWNSGIKSALEISDKIKIKNTTTVKYLKQGAELGWCNYDPKEVFKNHNNKKVICLTTGELFKSIKEASNKYNTKHISNCCSGKRKTAGVHPDTGEKLVWVYVN